MTNSANECEKAPKFTVTVFDSQSLPLNKTISLHGNKLIKNPNGAMWAGSYSTQSFQVDDLKSFIDSLQPTQALSIGVCNKGESGSIKPYSKGSPNSISRTKEMFDFSNCFLIDIDDTSLDINGVLPKLYAIDANLSTAPILVLPSSSHGIYHNEVELESSSNSVGYHVWVGGVKNPSDIPRYGKTFAKRCWLNGQGAIKVSSSGSLLVRQLIDAAVFSPERLIFEARPTLKDGLKQHERPYISQNGKEFDTANLESINDDEERLYKQLVKSAKSALKPEASLLMFGINNEDVFKVLLQQTLDALPITHDKDITANSVMAMLIDIKPQDTLEAMLITQMLATHAQAMEWSKRSTVTQLPEKKIQSNISRATKLMKTFISQVEALHRYRNKGKQTIQVQHVNIQPGGQAIVGDVSRGRG